MRRARYGGRNFRRAITIDDLRLVARRWLPNFSFEYVEGGAEDEVTLRRNRDVFERIAWLPQVLVGVGSADPRTELFGRPLGLPLVVAPTGFNGMLWPQGDIALARAATSAGIPFTLSTASNCAFSRLTAEVPGGDLWFQLYPYKDETVVDRLVDKVAAAGCSVLVITADAPVLGSREWDQRNYRAPMKLSAASILDVLLHPRWLATVMLPSGAPKFENLEEFLPPGHHSALVGAKYSFSQINPRLSWQDIERIRRRWSGKLVVKGLLRADDAQRAVDAGADGIVLSNHGGRQLDGAASAMEILPTVASQFGERLTVMVDGGFRRGTDVLKALALGADAVMIGRATLYGLAAGGQDGASHALGILRAEIERALMLLGCHTVADLGRHLIRN
jgi:(S)-mandelate dehydrogenase